MGFSFLTPKMQIEELYTLYNKYPLISTDTRKIEKNSIFFCLKGENFDGNIFAETALKNGAVYAVIDNPDFSSIANTILVNDALSTLQKLAHYHRQQIKIPVIGITGTNGKTTTKELINAVLSKKFKIISTKGNLNNHIGVPLTLLSIRKDTEIAIVEMGASHPDEIDELCSLAEPTAGIITNIGKAHLEGFKTLENIIHTKTALYRSIAKTEGVIFVNADNPTLISKLAGIHYITYGNSETNFCPGKLLHADPYILMEWGKSYENNLETHLAGSYNFENLLAAACIGLHYQVAENEINEALQNYQPTNMRSQIKHTEVNTILIDTYNANPSSMKAALENFSKMKSKSKVVILGDMLELGSDEETEHLNILSLLDKEKFTDILLIGSVFKRLATNKGLLSFPDADQALVYLKKNPLVDKTILIKGSRGIKLEKLLDAL
jgi:UDP-N-acetylmuramoyl-tripeptide--D-alanyl-D-alanine ligase